MARFSSLTQIKKTKKVRSTNTKDTLRRQKKAMSLLTKKLLSLGIEQAGIPSIRKMMALFKATEEGDLPRVKELIQQTELAIRKAQSGNTLLHVAVANNQLETVRFLLDYISPNVVNKNDQTPAHIASMEGYTEVLKILLADKEFFPDIRDIWQRTYKDWLAAPLFEAIFMGNTYQTKELLELGANPDYHAGSSVEFALEESLEATTARQLAFALGEEDIISMLPKENCFLDPTCAGENEFPSYVYDHEIDDV